MKTNPCTVKLPSLGLRSPEHEVFARDPAARREIAMIPIRVGDEATLKASGLRFSRTRLLPRFVEAVGDHRASLGDVVSGQGEAFEQSSIAFPGETPLTAATGRPIPDAAHLFIDGAKSIQVARQAVVRSARATRSPASDGSSCELLRMSTLLAFHEALEVA